MALLELLLLVVLLATAVSHEVDISFGHELPDLLRLPAQTCADVRAQHACRTASVTSTSSRRAAHVAHSLSATSASRTGPMACQTFTRDSKRVCFEMIPLTTVAHLFPKLATPLLDAFLCSGCIRLSIFACSQSTVRASCNHVRTSRFTRHFSD